MRATDCDGGAVVAGDLRSAPDTPISRSGNSFSNRQQMAARVHDAMESRRNSAENMPQHSDKLEVGFYEVRTVRCASCHGAG